jgi:hypothetical protein
MYLSIVLNKNLIAKYGVGMILFPKIIRNLKGTFKLDFKGEEIKVNFTIPFAQSRLKNKIYSPYLGFAENMKTQNVIRYKSPQIQTR